MTPNLLPSTVLEGPKLTMLNMLHRTTVTAALVTQSQWQVSFDFLSGCSLVTSPFAPFGCRGREAMEIAVKDGSATFAQLFYVRAAERLPIRTVTESYWITNWLRSQDSRTRRPCCVTVDARQLIANATKSNCARVPKSQGRSLWNFYELLSRAYGRE